MARQRTTRKEPPSKPLEKSAALPDVETPRARHFEGLVSATDQPRADRYIAEVLGLLSRSQLKARSATIEVNGRPAKPSRPLKQGERLVVAWTDEPSSTLVPEVLPLDILYEDERVLVLNKAAGMVTHPGAGNRRGTLANAVLGRLCAPRGTEPRSEESERPGLPQRGGIVHRLDKDTTGVIIVAKDAEAQAFLAAQFKDRTTRKEYLAITRGRPGRGGAEWTRIENRLGRDRRDRKRFVEVEEGGRQAITDWRVVTDFGDYTLVQLRPRTGRTHQLRVHLAGLGAPIAGDPIYGGRDRGQGDLGLMLHAWRLAICLPGETEARVFKAPLPRAFAVLLRRLETRGGAKKTRPSR